jgi:hypothetical protein
MSLLAQVYRCQLITYFVLGQVPPLKGPCHVVTKRHRSRHSCGQCASFLDRYYSSSIWMTSPLPALPTTPPASSSNNLNRLTKASIHFLFLNVLADGPDTAKLPRFLFLRHQLGHGQKLMSRPCAMRGFDAVEDMRNIPVPLREETYDA